MLKNTLNLFWLMQPSFFTFLQAVTHTFPKQNGFVNPSEFVNAPLPATSQDRKQSNGRAFRTLSPLGGAAPSHRRRRENRPAGEHQYHQACQFSPVLEGHDRSVRDPRAFERGTDDLTKHLNALGKVETTPRKGRPIINWLFRYAHG